MQRSFRKMYSREREHCKCTRPRFCLYLGAIFSHKVFSGTCSHPHVCRIKMVIWLWKFSRSCWQPPPADAHAHPESHGQHEWHELSLQEGSALLEEAELDDLNGSLLCKTKIVFISRQTGHSSITGDPYLRGRFQQGLRRHSSEPFLGQRLPSSCP